MGLRRGMSDTATAVAPLLCCPIRSWCCSGASVAVIVHGVFGHGLLVACAHGVLVACAHVRAVLDLPSVAIV